MGSWRITGAQVAGDVAMTGRAGADAASSAPEQQDFPAAPGDNGEAARDTAVPVSDEPASDEPASAEPAPTAVLEASPGPTVLAVPATPPATAPPGAIGGAAVRRRLSRLGATRGGGVNPVLEPLTKTVRATHPKADIRLIERAYDVAA